MLLAPVMFLTPGWVLTLVTLGALALSIKENVFI
jgi:hypothetical protein